MTRVHMNVFVMTAGSQMFFFCMPTYMFAGCLEEGKNKRVFVYLHKIYLHTNDCS